jgi:hypothetical protein
MGLMILRPFLLAVCLASPTQAGEWRQLDDAGIAAALTARVLLYQDGATQNFFADGRTLYEAESGESWGKWWVEGDRYCSTWPPSDTPACYNVDANGLDIRFTDRKGTATVGRYIDL